MRKIGEVSEITGVSRKTIRGYLEKGLINEAGKTEQGYLLFEDSVIPMINEIQMLQEAGYTREEIKDLLDKALKSASSEFEIITARLEEKKRRIEAYLKMMEFYKTLATSQENVFSGLSVSKTVELMEEFGPVNFIEDNLGVFSDKKQEKVFKSFMKLLSLRNKPIDSEEVQKAVAELGGAYINLTAEEIPEEDREDPELMEVFTQTVMKELPNCYGKDELDAIEKICGASTKDFFVSALKYYAENI